IKNKNNIENDKEIKNKNNIENDKEIKNKNNKNNIENDKKIKNKNNKKYIESDRDIKNKNSEKNKDLFDCDNNNDSIISDDLKIAIVEGHLSHLCEHCDKVIVLRLNPKILEKRLEKRDYLKSKIQENLEAESLAVCSVEAFQKHGDIVNEIDTTDMSIEEVATNIEKIISSEKDYPVGKIDFMDWLIRG
ncbi:MAG: AAA family ATPase, partial [Methanobrevibacter sp.]|nr:AAA family ATPase [Methanobrevibacter sp.]